MNSHLPFSQRPSLGWGWGRLDKPARLSFSCSLDLLLIDIDQTNINRDIKDGNWLSKEDWEKQKCSFTLSHSEGIGKKLFLTQMTKLNTCHLLLHQHTWFSDYFFRSWTPWEVVGICICNFLKSCHCYVQVWKIICSVCVTFWNRGHLYVLVREVVGYDQFPCLSLDDMSWSTLIELRVIRFQMLNCDPWRIRFGTYMVCLYNILHWEKRSLWFQRDANQAQKKVQPETISQHFESAMDAYCLALEGDPWNKHSERIVISYICS